MRIIDSHTHLTELSYRDLELMAIAGLEIVSPLNYSTKYPVKASTIRDAWDVQVDFQLPRAKSMLIEARAMLGVSMVSVPSDWENLMAVLPEYLKRDEVVAIGEIGFQPNSATCRDITVQGEIVRQQIEIAKEMDMPIVFHTPGGEDKIRYSAKCIEMCAAAGLPMERVLVDHCSELNIKLVLDAGAWAGISVQPWRRLEPADAASLVTVHGPERILLNSDCSRLASDSLAVPKTVLELRKRKVDNETIEKVAWKNAAAFYGLE